MPSLSARLPCIKKIDPDLFIFSPGRMLSMSGNWRRRVSDDKPQNNTYGRIIERYVRRYIYILSIYLHMTGAPCVCALNIYIVCSSHLSDTKTNREVNEPCLHHRRLGTSHLSIVKYNKISKQINTNTFTYASRIC